MQKKIFKIFSLFLLLFNISMQIYAIETKQITMWTTDYLRARVAPNLEAEIYDVLPIGSEVICIEQGKKWNKVLIKDKEYYMYNKYLSYEKQNIEIYSAETLKKMGQIWWNGWRWTWYSQRVLPGGGLSIPGRHISDNGYVMDENNRICLASSALPKGTIVQTPFGAQGCVYDTGCPYDTLDVYTNF